MQLIKHLKSFLLILTLSLSYKTLAQNVGQFYGSLDGTQSIDLKLGYRNSGSAVNFLFSTSYDNGSSNLFAHTSTWANWTYWQRNSSSGLKNIIKFGGSESLGHSLTMYDTDDGTTPMIALKSNSSSYFKNALGIGTTNAKFPLDIQTSDLYQGNNLYFGDRRIYLTRMTGEQTNRQAYVGFVINKQSTGHPTLDIVGGKNDFTSDKQPENLIARFTSAGRLGIGTDDPDSELAVAGKIHAEEVKVSTTVPAPDYVFEEDYPLASLDEIKAYISANKHLPEVPSAKEMEANGIKLGEMNMLLLKKIEELTLLLIQQEERIKKLENK